MLDGVIPYPDEFIERYRAKGYWQGKVVSDIIDESAEKYEQRVALVDNEQKYTYREIKAIVDNIAGRFLAFGFKHQERILIQLPNSAEFIFVYCACLKIGLIPVLCLRPFRYTEIRHLAMVSEARMYIIPPEFKGFDYLSMAREIKS